MKYKIVYLSKCEWCEHFLITVVNDCINNKRGLNMNIYILEEWTLVIIKRIGAVSVGKIFGLLYAIIGLIEGLLFALLSLFGGAIAGVAFSSALFGVGSIIIFPIMFGIMGFISGVLMAFLYNLAAGWIGGIEVETE